MWAIGWTYCYWDWQRDSTIPRDFCLSQNARPMLNSSTISLLNSLRQRSVEKLNVLTVSRKSMDLTICFELGYTERFSVSSIDFAKKLHERLNPHLPTFPYPSSMKRPAELENPRKPHSCNSNIRVYKYSPSQYFGYVAVKPYQWADQQNRYPHRPHYDDCVRDPLTGAKSEWTLLIYLTGCEDGVKNGEVNLN